MADKLVISVCNDVGDAPVSFMVSFVETICTDGGVTRWSWHSLTKMMTLMMIAIIEINAKSFTSVADVLKVKGPNISYMPPLTGIPERQRFTIGSGLLASTSIRRRGAFSGSPLPERTDFGPAVCSYTDIYAPASCTVTIIPQCFPASTYYFSNEYYGILITTHLPTPEGSKAELSYNQGWKIGLKSLVFKVLKPKTFKGPDKVFKGFLFVDHI